MSRPGTLAPRPGVLHRPASRRAEDPLWRRLAPTLLAGALGLAYTLVSPPSLDLPAHLFRAHLFSVEGFGFWNNYWYSGHNTVGYSLLFPPVAAALTPQLAAAIAATATAALFEPLARRHFGPEAWLGALLFGAATATNLLTGRLTFAFGCLPAMAALLALDRRRTWPACAFAALSALCSPVAALFAALAAGACALTAFVPQRRLRPALGPLAVAICALAPIAVLSIVFPEGGSEPFAFSAMWPILVLAAGTLLAAPRDALRLRAGAALYALATIAAYIVPSPLGSNAARLGTLVAAPLCALLWWRRRVALLLIAVVPLLYLGWQAPVRDLTIANNDPSATVGYYQPLLAYLERRPGPPFRIEIPFTQFPGAAYAVASRFAIARGWERQLDIQDNAIFYDGRLSATSYQSWLHQAAVLYVAVPDAPLDYSGTHEAKLIARGLPYLRSVYDRGHWHVYVVLHPTPIVQGPAILEAIGPDNFKLTAQRPGTLLLHAHFSPYWALGRGSGCVEDAGGLTRLSLRRAGPVALVMRFSLSRIGATSPRCT